MNDDAAGLLAEIERLSDQLVSERKRMRMRLIIGGPFGVGRYVLGSYPHVSAGLDAVHYFVLVDDASILVAGGDTCAGALAAARTVLRVVNPLQFELFIGRIKAKREAAAALERGEQRRLRQEAQKERAAAIQVRSIPKRRKQIFESSNGCCHYCGAALALDGKWHIEHKMPRALLGGNERSNLVASCVSCNTKKRDRTDEEFIAGRGGAA